MNEPRVHASFSPNIRYRIWAPGHFGRFVGTVHERYINDQLIAKSNTDLLDAINK